VKFTTIQIKKFDVCEQEIPKFKTESVSVIAGTELLEAKNFERLADIEAQQCLECNAIASVPEWWQLRPEATRKQAVLIYREIKPDGTIGGDHYSLTIPHFNRASAPSTPPLPQYEKGNFEGILTLSDNSKLIVNCIDSQECARVIGAIEPFIEAQYLAGSSIKIGERIGLPFKKITVKAWRLDYYPTGVKSTKPAYLKSYF
jgi:hypothetical protein